MIPEKVRVGYRVYAIEIMDRPIAEAENCFGNCDHKAGIINLAVHHKDHEVANTLLHEILHCCWRVGGLDQIGEATQEQVVTILSNTFQQVMQDNPSVMTWISKRSKI